MNSPATARRALIVIDVQNEYVTGDLPIEYPDVHASLANIARAMDAAHAANVPIVVVQNSAPAGAPIFAPGTDGWALHASVAGRTRDHYVEKRLPDCFAGTDLGEWLQARKIDTLAVVGYMTHNCVDSTIKHALHAGYAIEYLHDASGSVPYANRAGAASAEQIHRTFCVVLQSRFAAVLSTDEWLAVLRGEAQPVRESIVASNRNARASRSARAA